LALRISSWILYLAALVLGGLGVLYLMAAYYEPMRLMVGSIFMIVALLIVFFARERKPPGISHKVPVLGPLQVKEVKCPNCGAVLDANKTQLREGVPMTTCQYRGKTFEVT
jgi:hypothetical protein